MKSGLLFCLFVLVAVVCARPRPGGTYTARYDNINLDEILRNKRLLVPYLKCILDQGKCTPDGKELRSHIREGLAEDCAKCTSAQRRGTDRVLAHLANNEPEYWGQLKAKYDPSGQYSRRHERH